MLKRLGTSLAAIACGMVLLGTPAHTFDGGANVAPAPAAGDSLSGKCYLALSPEPLLFGMDFKDNSVFEVSFCGPEGAYQIESEFLVFTFWNATTCDSSDGPLTFDGILIASALHLFRAEGPSTDMRGIAFRVPCDLIP
jgi:hypothetical protein